MHTASEPFPADLLAERALAAATALDRLQRHQHTALEPVEQFLKLLSAFSGGCQRGGVHPLALDPISSEMFSRALARASGQSVSNVSELDQKINEIVSRWSESLRATDHEHILESLKDFCLSIHEAVNAQYDDVTTSEYGVPEYGLSS